MLSEIRLTTSKKILGWFDTTMIKEYPIESILKELSLIWDCQVNFVNSFIQNNTFYAFTSNGTMIYFNL